MAHSKFFQIALIIIIAVACSSHKYRRPESIEDKIARFNHKTKAHNTVPDMQIMSHNFKSPARIPASTKAKKRVGSEFSNKRLYFLTLFEQYNQLQAYSPISHPQISSCPTFHTAIVKHSEKFGAVKASKKRLSVNFDSNPGKWTPEYVAMYPELSLPVTRESLVPTVADILRKNEKTEQLSTVTAALNTHLSKTYDELYELCETGVSDNYYIFENMITYIKDQRAFRGSSQNMKTLLKTTVFANMSLINSLASSKRKNFRKIASLENYNQYSNEIIDRLNVEWSREYLRRIYNKK